MSDSNTPAPAPSPKPRRSGFWKWVKRLCLVFLGILVVLVIFHRPLLRWGANAAMAHFAGKAGYQVEGLIQGSILSDLSLPGLRVTGPDQGVVSSVRWQEAELNYSLMDLIRHGPGRFLHRLVLKDAEVVIDLRHPRPKPPPDPAKEKSGSLPDIRLEHLEIRRVTVRVLMPENEILVRDLNLVMTETSPGQFSLAELRLPAQSLYLSDVSARTQVGDGWVRLADLRLMPDLVFNKLDVKLSNLEDGDLPLDLDLTSGTGHLQAQGKLLGVGKPTGLKLDLDLAVDSLAQTEVTRWAPLPQGMAWTVNKLTGKVTGDPVRPQELSANLDLDASGVAISGVKLDSLKAQLAINKGKLTVPSLKAVAGANEVTLGGQASLPARWNEIAKSEASVDLTLNAPTLEQFLPKNPPVHGGIQGKGTVAVKDGLLTLANLNVESSDLVAGKVALSEFKADVASDAKSIQIRGITARLNDQNAVNITGTVQLAGRQSTSLVVSLQGDDLSTLSQTKEWLDVYPPAGGSMKGTVNATFDIADLKEKNYQRIVADGTLGIDGLQWNQGTLQQALVGFGFKENKVTVSQLSLVLDDQNKVSLTADALITGDQPVNVAWDIDMEQVVSLTAWIQPESNNTLPPPQSGVLISKGKAAFTLAALKAKRFAEVAAEASVSLRELHWLNGTLEKADLVATFAGGKVTAPSLTVRFDEENQITGSAEMALDAPSEFTARLQGGLKNLPGLSGWLELFKGPAIGSGSLALDWQGSGKFKPFEVAGNGTVKLEKFSLDGNPNTYSLDLTTRHEGRRAELTRLLAQAGKFRLEAAGAVSETDLEISQLLLTSGDTSLVEGKVAVPLVLAQTPRPKIPVDPKREVAVSLRLRKLKFEEIFAALGKKAPPLAGLAEGEVQLNGKLASLRGKVDLKLQNVLADAVKGKLQPANVTFAANLDGGRLTLDAQAQQRPLQALTLKASLPLDPQKAMADPAALQNTSFEAELILPESDLGFVPGFVPALAKVQGKVSANVKLHGTAKEPHWNGSVNLAIPSADLAATQMSIRDVKARLSFVEKRIALEDVSAILAGGEIRASGGVDVADLTKPNINVRVSAKEALIVRDDTMSLRANANVSVTGPLDGASVAGRVELVRGRVFKEIEFLPLSLPNQLPPPPPPVKRSNAKPSAPPPFDKWKLDVAVVTKDPIRLLGNVLNGGIVVNLHAGGTGGAPEVTGRATFDNARVQLPFSRLAITRGNVIFTKERPLDPELDLQGDSIVGNYVVTLFAYGAALSPKVRFTSNPPLSEGEIATLLATGSTAGDLTSSEGVAANRAAFLLLSQTYRKLFKKAAPRRLDEEPPKLSFSFSPISTGNTQRAVTATYEISPNLQAIGEVGERGTFRGLLHYLVRFR